MKIAKKYNPFFIFAIVFLVIFLFFSYAVRLNLFNEWDVQTITYVQKIFPVPFDTFFSLLSLLGSFEIMGAFLFLVLLFHRKFKYEVISFTFFISAHVIEFFGKAFLYHPGPPHQFFRYNIGFLFPSAFVQPGSSYPSGHSLRIVFLSVILSYLTLHTKGLDKTKRYIALIFIGVFTFLMLLSRISLGEHWTTDVVGGSIFGASMAFFTLVFF